MKWISTILSERLNIGNGIIKANIHKDKGGYILSVNSKTFPVFNTKEEAKKAAENHIRDSLNIAIKEI